eukprot:6559172-Prymnesium_polylepis.1
MDSIDLYENIKKAIVAKNPGLRTNSGVAHTTLIGSKAAAQCRTQCGDSAGEAHHSPAEATMAPQKTLKQKVKARPL